MQQHRSKLPYILIAIVLLGVLLGVILTIKTNKRVATNQAIQVVAGENFWGSLVSQLGGTKVHVISIISGSNLDPHEYESNTATARAFANADYVILNGAGYDSWGDKLLSANPSTHRRVLNVAAFLGKKPGDNPHFWYSPAYVNAVVGRMEQDLIAERPTDAPYFRQRLQTLDASLATYQNRITAIKQRFAGTKVAATENVFQYLADAAGLDLISPKPFIQAIAEGDNPPASSVATFQQQLKDGQAKLLVYNKQTVTPLTMHMKLLAEENKMPVIGMTETIQPSNATFQNWMNAELVNLENSLNSQISGK